MSGFCLDSASSSGCLDSNLQELADLPLLPFVTRFTDAVLEFVADEGAKAKEGESLLASTETIESLIGTGERLEAHK